MGDVDDADLLCFEPFDYGEECLHLAVGEGGGWFVHDDDPRLTGEGAGDFY